MLNKPKQTKSNVFLLGIIFLVIFLCSSLWYMRYEYRFDTENNVTIYSDSGHFNLTEFDFSGGFAITRGSEEYVAGELLDPYEFAQIGDEIDVGHPGTMPVNTSRIILYMPDDSDYIIMGNSFDFAERIYINGEFVLEVGTVGTTAQTSTPDYSYLSIHVTPVDGVIELVRQSNNFVHQDNGSATNILIGTPEIMNNLRSVEYSITGVMIGLFFTIAISHIFFFSLFKKHKSHLYFAILSITWGLRMGVTGIKIFSEWFPSLPWEFFFRLEYMTVPITSAMMLLVIREIFPKTLPKLFLKIYVAGFLLYALACIFIPTYPLSHSMIYLQAAFIIASLLLPIFMVRKLVIIARVKRVKVSHILFIIGYIPFILSLIHDAFYYNSILLFGVSVLFIDLSLMIIVVTQTAVIYYDSAKRIVANYKAEQKIRIEAASLRQAKEMHESFLQTLSHEMQLPLTAVSGYAQLTAQILSEDETLDRKSITEKMRVIDDEARKLSRQVSQLLDASAMENGSFKLFLTDVSISEVFFKIASHHFPIMNDKNIALEIQNDSNLPYLLSDEERLLHVLLNIISNAIKHSECTKIILRVDVCDEDSKFANISVIDNGKGIAPQLIDDFFSRYPKNRSEKGNGLGLYIVSQTVEAWGGKISFESKENGGTKIFFTVPISEVKIDDE